MQKGSRLVMAMVVSWMLPAIATAEMWPAVCMVPAAEVQHEDLAVSVGVEKERVWLESNIEGLRVRKFTQKGGATVLELHHGNDAVVISVSPGHISALRNGKTVTFDPANPQSLDAVQDLLAPSRAIIHARTTLSRFERRSALKAPQMSLLASLAFVSSIMGDVGAPARLGERFAAVHGGRVRPVRLAGSCWTNYTGEVSAAMDDVDACYYEAYQGSWTWRKAREAACYAMWLLRVEAAWFELLKCTGAPLAAG